MWPLTGDGAPRGAGHSGGPGREARPSWDFLAVGESGANKVISGDSVLYRKLNWMTD